MNIIQHTSVAFVLRIFFIFYGELHDSNFAVKYTDIDYHVFSDAAELVNKGYSPFGRHTYRYTPFLAFLMYPNTFLCFCFGKILFSVLDVLTGLFIFIILQNYGHTINVSKQSAFLWLYNPLVIVIATRGSCESVMTSLTMLSVLFLQYNHHMCAGLAYGFSVHFKLYPAIYALSLYNSLAQPNPQACGVLHNLYILLFPCWSQMKFIIFTVVGFIFPTLFSWYWYGAEYINEAFLYHIVRKDVKHNFSPYFYATYLYELGDVNGFNILKLAFPLQAILVVLVTLSFRAPRHLPVCLFVQTFVFVTFNKVCTSQYFLWYFCLFPLNFPLMYQPMIFKGIILWFSGQIIWLLPAYYLEFQGSNTFLLLWGASLIMFSINIFLICSFCRHVLCNSVECLCTKTVKEK